MNILFKDPLIALIICCIIYSI